MGAVYCTSCVVPVQAQEYPTYLSMKYSSMTLQRLPNLCNRVVTQIIVSSMQQHES